MRLRFAKMYPYVPLRGCNKYKKKTLLILFVFIRVQPAVVGCGDKLFVLGGRNSNKV